jgi:hypothetical protein
VLLAVVAVFAVLFGGRYLGWYGAKPPTPVAAETTGQTPEPTSVTVSPPPAPDGATPARPRPRPAANPAPETVTPVPAAAAAVPTLITNWEQRIDTLLTEPGDEAAKGRELLAMLPNMPEDGQVEAAQHISNLLGDEDFKLLSPTLTNAAVAEAVLDVLMTDVLNRPNGLKLPALLDVARIPNHPKAAEARDILEVFVDENYGDDWNAWRAAVEKWMKENPDE